MDLFAKTELWSAVAALATCATLVVLSVAGALAYGQLREAARARQLQSALAVVDYVSSPEYRNARRFIYGKRDQLGEFVARNPEWEQVDQFLITESDGKLDLDRFHSYLAAVEHLSMLVMHDLAPDDLIEMYWGRMAPRHWRDLGPFIVYARARYGSDDFLQHFEMLNQLLEEQGLRLRYLDASSRVKRGWRKSTRRSLRMKRRLLRTRRDERARRDAAKRQDAILHRTESAGDIG